jgi:hypothetical protein
MENDSPNTNPQSTTPEPILPPMPEPINPPTGGSEPLPTESQIPTPVVPIIATPPIPPITPVSAAPQYTPPVQPISQPQNPEGKNFMSILVLLGIVALVVAIGILYVLSLRNATPVAKIPSETSPITTLTPTPTATPTLESDTIEIQGIDTGDPTEDLKTINSDLSEL